MAITTVSSHVVSVNAIQGTLIADNAITAVHIATNAVSGTLIADNAVTAVHVAQNSITVTQLADDCVESDKIADGVITTNHLNKAMISSQTEVTAVAGDFVLLGDTSDSNNLKKAAVSSLAPNSLPLAGGTMSGVLNMGSQNITNIAKVGINNAPLSGSQVYIKKLDGSTNLQRWGEGTDSDSANSYRFRIDQNYKFIANSGSGDTISLDSSTGSVGIGNASPSSFSGDGDNLVIGTTSGDNGLSIISGTSNSGSIYFGDTQEVGSASRRGQLVYNHSDDSMRVFTSAAERVRISADGYMQMGTSKGNATYNAMFNIVDNAGTSNSLIKLRNGTGNKAIQFHGDNNVEYGYIGLDAQSGAASLLIGSVDNGQIRMQSGGMRIELTDGSGGSSSSFDTGSLSISNTDLDADTTYNIRNGRYLTSNGTGWGSADGKNPALVIHNDTTSSNDRTWPGIMMHNESNQNDVYGPFIGWGSKSASGNYNTGYAWITGCPTGTGPDSNWKAGQLELYTQDTAYVSTKPGIRITSAGLVQKPRQYDANGFFWARATSNPTGQTGTTGVIFTTRAQAGSGNFSTSTGRYTTPVEGIYHFSSQVRIDGVSADNIYMRIAFYTGTSPSVSQTSYGQGHAIYGPGSYSQNYFSMATSWSVHLAANVQVGVAVYADSSATYSIHTESNFSGHLVG